MRAEALMHGGDAAPLVRLSTPLRDVIYEMSRKGLGMTCVVDDGRRGWPGSSRMVTCGAT